MIEQQEVYTTPYLIMLYINTEPYLVPILMGLFFEFGSIYLVFASCIKKKFISRLTAPATMLYTIGIIIAAANKKINLTILIACIIAWIISRIIYYYFYSYLDDNFH